MRILCFIDSLVSGGAQRQLVNLAIGFQKKGHDVSFLTYSFGNFYLSLLEDANIEVYQIETNNYVSRVLECRSFIRKGRYDVVLSFLETPSFISEVAGFPFHKWKIVVGERSASPRILNTLKGRVYRLFHLLADMVVSNSTCNRDMVQKAIPLLSKRKNITIYNSYDLDWLNPQNYKREGRLDGKFHLLVAASHLRLKNLKNLAIAISLLTQEKQKKLLVEWYGRQEDECFKESLLLIRELEVEGAFQFYPPTLEVYSKMFNADAVGLFSIYEGLPNTICEAMCLGKPVIATDVSDNRYLLQNDKLISDAFSPQSIAETLSYLLELSVQELENIGERNRNRAKALFDEEIIVSQYLTIFGKN